MRIIVVSPGRLKTVPMFEYASNALETLGHSVYKFNLSPTKFDRITSYFNSDKIIINFKLQQFIQKIRPDFILFIFGFDVSEKTFNLIKSLKIPNACWWLNDPFQTERSLHSAHQYNFLFTNAKKSVNFYRNNGIQESYWLPTGCDPNIHKRMPIFKPWLSEICFAGDWSPMRESWCELLYRHYDLKILGPWKKKVSSKSPLNNCIVGNFFDASEMATLFSSSKMVFNIHSWRDKWNYGTNPRLFEAAGCGTAQLVDIRDELDELFNLNNLIVYQDQASLINRIEEKINSSDLSSIAHRAQSEAYKNHTYINRMESLLKVCFR